MADTDLKLHFQDGINPVDWDALVSHLPEAHFLQTWEWAQVKQPVGWQPLPVVWEDGNGQVQAAALILLRRMRIAGRSLPVKVMYAPRGPLLDWDDQSLRRRVLADLAKLARRSKAIFFKIDPDVAVGLGFPGGEDDRPDPTGLAVKAEFRSAGWRFSPDQIQFRNTVLIDLDCQEEELLERMKQKTRYNIRLAEKKGVVVSPARVEDLGTLFSMYAETSIRDGFVIREEAYYRRVWGLFMERDLAEPLIAWVNSEPVAGVVVIRFGRRAWYVYGMSRQAHREKMPNYLLQWEAMRRARLAGCSVYDLWGAPDTFDEHDAMWGVYRFKEGLGGQVCRSIGAWDYISSPALYRLYTYILPRLLNVMRRRGRVRTAQEAGL